MENIDLTILIPCLNEEKTIGTCITKANKFILENNINGEVLIANNGSTDNSEKIAKSLGARVEYIEKKGYGNALINGSKLAKGKYVIMADADDSYNFSEILPIYEQLKKGYELVVGNRFKGNIEKGAMKFSHRYIGTPLISLIARLKHKVKLGDFNCGMRGYETEKINNLNCVCEGMKYASEMLIRARRNNLKMVEVPINLYKDGRNGKSHLNTICYKVSSGIARLWRKYCRSRCIFNAIC